MPASFEVVGRKWKRMDRADFYERDRESHSLLIHVCGGSYSCGFIGKRQETLS